MIKILHKVFGAAGTFFAVVLCLSVIYLPDALGRLEGRLFPVVANMQIEATERNAISAHVGGSFEIVRPGCEFQRIEWKLVGQLRSTTVDVSFLDGNIVRAAGFNAFGPWLVAMSKHELERSSVAAVFHQCPSRPWLTQTHFYP
ncbi:MAG: hypothetical protein KI788_14160 [Mameliella sp.]|nr:hypothetical protein [Mameliella sp.]